MHCLHGQNRMLVLLASQVLRNGIIGMWPKPPVEHHQSPTLPTAVGHLQYVTKNTRTGRSGIAIPARSADGGRCNQLKPGTARSAVYPFLICFKPAKCPF